MVQEGSVGWRFGAAGIIRAILAVREETNDA
jgi:hypothetical protein